MADRTAARGRVPALADPRGLTIDVVDPMAFYDGVDRLLEHLVEAQRERTEAAREAEALPVDERADFAPLLKAQLNEERAQQDLQRVLARFLDVKMKDARRRVRGPGG